MRCQGNPELTLEEIFDCSFCNNCVTDSRHYTIAGNYDLGTI